MYTETFLQTACTISFGGVFCGHEAPCIFLILYHLSEDRTACTNWAKTMVTNQEPTVCLGGGVTPYLKPAADNSLCPLLVVVGII
jgi:hypothetical protein